MQTIKDYQTDVRTMSDEELARLSEEIETECGEDCYFTDDETEARYYEMRREIRRREDERDPEAAARRMEATKNLTGLALRALANNLDFGRMVTRQFDAEFSGGKVGDTAAVRKPIRFLSI